MKLLLRKNAEQIQKLTVQIVDLGICRSITMMLSLWGYSRALIGAVLTVLSVAAIFILMERPANTRKLQQPDRFTDVTKRTESPCPVSPIVVVGFGQSNSANHLAGPEAADPQSSGVNFFNGKCYMIEDPVLGASQDRRAPELRGSLWTRFAHRLSSSVNKPVLIVSVGVGAFSVDDWLQNKHGALDVLKEQLDELHKKNLNVDYYIWHQGEADTMFNQDTSATYAARLNRLFDKVAVSAKSANATFLVHLSSRCREYGPSERVRLGQQSVIDARDDTVLALDTDLLDNSFRRDACHFNARGTDRIANGLVDRIRELEQAKIAR